jgi:hypothetical protein
MLPRKVQIKGHTYPVRHVGARKLGPDTFARLTHDHIDIWKKATPVRKIECLIHEALHAMLTGHNFKDEETILTLLSEDLTQFIRDNPAFIRHALKTLCP